MATLSRDEWDCVMSFLGVRDLVSVSMVNRRLRKFAHSHRPRLKTPIFAPDSKRTWPHMAFVESFQVSIPVTCLRADDTHLYMGHIDGSLAKFDMHTHTICWRVVCPGAREWRMTVGPEHIYTGDNNGYVKRISQASGDVLWCFRCDSDVNALSLKNDLLLVGCTDGMLRAMDTENGANVWTHYDETEIVCISNVKETVQYSNSFGMVAQLDARTGAVGGIQTAPSPYFPLPTARALGSDWVVSGAEKCSPCCPIHPFCDFDDPECDLRGVVYRQNTRTRQVSWAVDVDATVECVHEDRGRLFITCSDCNVRQLDLATGEIRWNVRLPKPAHDVHVCGKRLYVTETGGFIHRIPL